MKIVRFRGRARHLPNDSLHTRPLEGVWYVGAAPRNFSADIPLYTERLFDRALAERYGRSCGPACQGDCFAEYFVAVWNINSEKNAAWFEVVDPAPPTAPTEPPVPTEPTPTQPAVKTAKEK